EKLKEQIYYLHTKGVSSTDLARDNHISNSTVERYFQQIYQRKNKMISQRSWPKVLGIDEHFVHKNKFATTFCDLRKHRVFDLKLGRRASELQSYIQQIPGADKVKVVCIDLSQTYKKMIQQCFPNALIVADRFHVVRLINHAFMKAYRSIKTDIRYHRQFIRLLITSPEKLSKNQILNQQKLFKEQPAIYHLYLAHQQLLKIMKNKHLTARKAKPVVYEFLNFIKLLKSSRFQSLVKLGNTLYKWKDEIARMWRFTKNNGITEGFHRKMKLIQRRAYGFR
ncbi:ISL3 family transposase, partial [Thiotrichales bacterium 19X7-9]|nr:ISL3 family transposase [Thiotrichales bacterium 19X7-9]